MLDSEGVVRFATLADAASIVSLVEGAYRGEASRVGWTTEDSLLGGQRTDEEEVCGLLTSEQTKFLLWLQGEALLGSVLLRCQEGEGYIGMFAVTPAAQGQGVGKKLLKLAEDQLRVEFSASIATMTVLRQRPELIAWYERRGYKWSGQTQPFPYGNRRFGIPKQPDLEFIVLKKHLV